MNDARVLPCVCKHPYQDKKYGVGRRLMIMKQKSKGRPPQEWTCTVCGRVTSA